MDPITVWNFSLLSGPVGELLKDLAKSGTKDLAERFFKASLGNAISQVEPSVVQKAMGRSIHCFLDIFWRELEHTEALTFIRDQFHPALKAFLEHPEALYILGGAFDMDVRILNAPGLKRLWADLRLPEVPQDFDWEVVCGNYLRDVRRSWRQDPKLHEIFNAENLKRARDVLENMAGAGAGFDLLRYREAVIRLYSHLKLDSFDVSGQDYKMRLRTVFVTQEVREAAPFYDVPKDVLKRLQSEGTIDNEIQLDEWDSLKHRYLQLPLRNAQVALDDPDCHHCVLLGDAGSGKSSLAQTLVLRWAELSEGPLPILIELRSYAQDIGSPRGFLDYLQRGEGCSWRFDQRELDEWIRTRDSLFIFEGLDEVVDPVRRHDTTRAILRFGTEYPMARILITSRFIGYNGQELRNAGFRHFTLQEFSASQIETFLLRWHDEAFPGSSDRSLLRSRLQTAIEESRALSELAGNPLLLTMLAILNRNQELPRDRTDAYEQMSRVLLHHWDVNKFLREHAGILGERISRVEKQAMLRRIALDMQAGPRGLGANLITRDQLESVVSEYLREVLHFEQPEVAARAIIQQLRERNFVLCQAGADYFAFVHRTFLEYFCASAFIDQFHQTLSVDNLRQSTFDRHWRDDSWREVLKLIAGMTPQTHAASLIGSLLDQDSKDCGFENVFLAAECWKELGNPRGMDSVRHKLWQGLEQATQFRRSPKDLSRGTATALRARDVQTRAVKLVGTCFANDKKALEWLKDCAEYRGRWVLRQAAIRALARTWKSEIDIHKWMKWWARPDEEENVRVTAIQEIARNWPENPETLDWLKSLAESDDNWEVRRSAIHELIRGWKLDPATIDLLKFIAGADPHEDVRSTAKRLLDGL